MGLEIMVMTYDVVLATYNGCDYLESMLDSILLRPYPPKSTGLR